MSDREQFEAARAAGLKARHETRVERAREREAASDKPTWSDLFGIDPDYTKDAESDERAIRRQVAEEIAEACLGQRIAYDGPIADDFTKGWNGCAVNLSEIAREIGAKETS